MLFCYKMGTPRTRAKSVITGRMSQDNHRTSGRKSSEEDRHVLAALGVTAHAASSIESAFEAHAEHALSAHEARQLEARLGKVRTVIAGLEGRLSKTQSTATLDRLLSRLDDARGEERVILKSISGAGDQSDAKTRDLSEQLLETDAPRRPDVLPFLVGLPVKREAHPDAIERHVQKDVSPPDASASEDEEASDGESKESVEQIDDDGDEQVYQRRMHAWCLDSSVPEHFFESSLAEQCLQVRRAFQDIPHVCIAKDRFWITADLWNNDMLPYQRDGLQWLLSHYDRREGGILADEMVRPTIFFGRASERRHRPSRCSQASFCRASLTARHLSSRRQPSCANGFESCDAGLPRCEQPCCTRRGISAEVR